MGTLNDTLKALIGEEELVATVALAKKVGSTEDTVRSQLSKLKNKGYVDGSTKEGWIITPEGRESVEREEKIPTTAKDVGADTESKLKYYGQLATVPPDVILAALELILTGDPEDLDSVWNAMTTMDVPIMARRKWWHLWRNHLKQGIPPSLKEKVVGTQEEADEEAGEAVLASARDKGRDYIIVDDMPVPVGPGLGDYTMKDAKELLQIKAIKARFAGGGGGGPQQWGPKELMEVIDKVTEKRGDGGGPKTYVVQQTEQGAIVKELQPGEPLALAPPGGSKPSATFLVDHEGNTQEIQPGHPIIIKQSGNPPPAPKTILVRQTAEGIVTEEFEAGKPIILNAPSPGGSGMPATPFPVFGKDGKPITDSEGRPVYADLEPTLRWMGFQGEQRRADEKHKMLMGLGETARENIPDGIKAVMGAIEEARTERKGQATTTEAQPKTQVYRCAHCPSQFGPPAQEGWTHLKCPGCGHVYTREEIEQI